MKSIDLSVVIPLYNEEESITKLYESVFRVIDILDLDSEVIFVDDGSKDNTFAIAKGYAEKNSKVRVIRFRKNYGQTAAMAAGIEFAKGKIIVTMDGDLQNDPKDIPRFIEKIREGYDIVCGWREKRHDKLISRKIPSVVANWLIGKITGVRIKDNGCSLKAYRSEIIKSIPLYSDMHRFIPAMASLAGTSVAEITVTHHPRQFGVSKYGISRVYKVVVDLLVVKILITSATRPLRFFAAAGLGAMGLGALLSLGSVTGAEGNARIDFMIASGGLLFFVLSFFLVLVGLVCELASRTGTFRTLANVNARIE